MKSWRQLGSLFLFLLVTGALAFPGSAQSGAKPAKSKPSKASEPPTWVELGENGAIIARQVLPANSKCHVIKIDGAKTPMQQRGTPFKGFEVVVCQAVIPNSASSASIEGISLPLPKAKISNIVLIGDTGCKGDTGTGMKSTPLEEEDEDEEAEDPAPSAAEKSKPDKPEQKCTSAKKWPFATVATLAAGKKPDLVIHVGDYVYVNEKHWKQWYGQFFKPAHDLLLAAPWIFVRGNHEICKLHGTGFFYLLDPRPTTSCLNDSSADSTPPYVVKAGGAQFVVMDSSGAKCDLSYNEPVKPGKKVCNKTDFEQEIATWTPLFSQAKPLFSGEAFLLTHRPLWGIKKPDGTNPPGFCPAPEGTAVVAINATMQAAYQQSGIGGIKMVLSGHIHNFQLITYKKESSGVGPQLVVGDSGVKLSTPPATFSSDCKLTAQGGPLDLSTYTEMKEHGFGVLTSDGSKFDLYLSNGKPGLTCSIDHHKADCK